MALPMFIFPCQLAGVLTLRSAHLASHGPSFPGCSFVLNLDTDQLPARSNGTSAFAASPRKDGMEGGLVDLRLRTRGAGGEEVGSLPQPASDQSTANPQIRARNRIEVSVTHFGPITVRLAIRHPRPAAAPPGHWQAGAEVLHRFEKKTKR